MRRQITTIGGYGRQMLQKIRCAVFKTGSFFKSPFPLAVIFRARIWYSYGKKKNIYKYMRVKYKSSRRIWNACDAWAHYKISFFINETNETTQQNNNETISEIVVAHRTLNVEKKTTAIESEKLRETRELLTLLARKPENLRRHVRYESRYNNIISAVIVVHAEQSYYA